MDLYSRQQACIGSSRHSSPHQQICLSVDLPFPCRLGPHDPHTQDCWIPDGSAWSARLAYPVRAARRACFIENMFHRVAIVKFRGLWTDGLPSGEPLVVKIIMGVGYSFRRPVVVISGGWLPLWVVGCLLLFCFGAWFSKAEPGMIISSRKHEWKFCIFK